MSTRRRPTIDPEIKKGLDDPTQRVRLRVLSGPEDPNNKPGWGFKSLYQEAFLTLAYKVALLGATNEDLADIFEVHVTTVNKWMREKEGFRDAIEAGRKLADANVAHSLYRRATGYSHPAVKVFYDKDRGEVIQAPYTEYYPPDTVAAMFWLRSRQGDKWDGQGFALAHKSVPRDKIIEGEVTEAKLPTIVINPVKVVPRKEFVDSRDDQLTEVGGDD